MADRTLTVKTVGQPDKTLTINRDRFAGVRTMTRQDADGGSSTITINRSVAGTKYGDKPGQPRPLLGKVVGGAAAAFSLRDLNDKQGTSKILEARRDADNAEKTFKGKDMRTLEDWVNGKLEDTLPADVDTAAAAYSLRKVRDAYTGNALQVRRPSDNVEVNVAFDANNEVSASSAITNISTGYEDLFGVRAYFDGNNDNVELGSQISMTGDLSLQYSFIVSQGNQQIIGRNTTGSYIRAQGSGSITSFRVSTETNALNLNLISSINYNEAHTIKVKRVSGAWGIYNASDTLISNTVSNGDTFVLDSFGRARGSYGQGVIWDVRVDTNNDGTIDHSYNGYGNTLSDWEDLVGSNDATSVNGSPELFNGQGFGLDEGETTATTLGGFLTEGVTIYQPDYSTATGLAFPSNVNLYANQDGIGGKDDALKLEVVSTGTGTVHRAYKSGVDSSGGGTDSVTVSYEIFVPSGSASQEKLGVALEYSATNKPAADYPSALDTWETVTHTFDGGINTRFYIHVASVGGSGINNAIFTGTTGDHVYIRNLKVEQVKNGAHVVTWYDQSVNGYDATQDTTGEQPKIAEAGSLLSEGLLIESGQHFSRTLSGVTFALNDASSFVLGRAVGGQGVGALVAVNELSRFSSPYRYSSTQGFRYGGESTSLQPRNQSLQIFTLIGGSTTADGYANGTLYRSVASSSASSTNPALKIGSYSGNLITGEVKEIIIYTSDQSDNRFKIESNINNHYGIYNAGDQLTLPTATNLNGTLTNASSTGGTMAHTGTAYMGWEFPETLNTGAKLFVSFDLNIDSGSAGILIAGATVGVAGSGRSLNVDVNASGSYAFPLDITADGATHFRFKSQTGTYQYTVSNLRIIEGGYNGFVETWYDQSGNGNHASQASTGLQPKIVDAGTYISVLDFDGSDDTFSIDVGSSPNTFSMFFVAKVESFTSGARIFQFGTGNTSTLNLRADNGDGTYEIEAFIRTSGTNGRYRWDIPANTTGLFSAIFDYSTFSLDLYLNGSLLTRTDATAPTGTWTVPSGNFLNISGPSVFLNSEFKELTFYASDQSANRSAIEDNINSHYSIYP